MKLLAFIVFLISIVESRKSARVKRRKLKKNNIPKALSNALNDRELFSPQASLFRKSPRREPLILKQRLKKNPAEDEAERRNFFVENPAAPLSDFIEKFNIRGFRNAPPVRLKSNNGHFGPAITAFGSTEFKKRLITCLLHIFAIKIELHTQMLFFVIS